MAQKKNTARVLIASIFLAACSTGFADEAAAPDKFESALTVVEDFIAASNSGDVEASLAFFRDMDGAVEGNYFGPEGELFLAFTGLNGYKWLANRVAADSRREAASCSQGTDTDPVITVECAYESVYAVRAAVGAPTLETNATFRIQEGTIVGLEENVIAAGPNVGHGYIGWLAGRNPFDASVALLYEWKSIEQAIQSGEAEARHADEYGVFIDANGCEMTGC